MKLVCVERCENVFESSGVVSHAVPKIGAIGASFSQWSRQLHAGSSVANNAHVIAGTSNSKNSSGSAGSESL